jgi:integrase
MARKRYTPEQIIAKLREADVRLAAGEKTKAICRSLGIAEQTYYRWRREYGGLKVSDVFSAGSVRERAMVIQKKTSRPVQFEITKLTATSLVAHVQKANLSNSDFLFPSRNRCSEHLSKRRYHRIVDKWVTQIGLKVSDYGTHSLRRTKVAQLYRNTGNLRAVQLLLGHAKIESTIRYLGIELEDALQISEALEI